MIVYKGIKHVDPIYFILFENENNQKVEVPIDKETAGLIAHYLDTIATYDRKAVDRGNDEETDQ